MNIGPRRTCPSCGNEFSGAMQFCLVVEGPFIAVNLAVVYAWTDEPDLAFKTLVPLGKRSTAAFSYGELKLDPYWDPLRNDPRFDKLLAELASRD